MQLLKLKKEKVTRKMCISLNNIQYMYMYIPKTQTSDYLPIKGLLCQCNPAVSFWKMVSSISHMEKHPFLVLFQPYEW